ncbi:MAG: MFS transporter [Candidatus Izemoplasmatales bacterium]
MKSEILKYKLFYFIRYFGDALFYPFMSIYFIAKGISEQQLGIILAITPIATVIVNPFWNYLIKDTRISQIVMRIMTLIEGILIIALTQVSGFELYALIVCLIAMLCSPFIAIQDGFCATFANENQLEFSSLRIYASIAYVIATAMAGFLILYLGYEFLFIVSGAFFLLTVFISWWIKPLEKTKNQEDRPKRDFKALMHNKEFYKYLLFYTLIAGTIRIGDSFFGVYATGEMGLNTDWWGMIYAAFVLLEVVTLRFLTLKGYQYSEKKLFLIANVLILFRYISYSLNLPLPIILATTMLRGISWGIYLYAHIKYVIKIVKMENITMAILIVTLLSSIYAGIGSVGAGLLIGGVGYQTFYLVLTGLIAIGLICFLGLTPKIDQTQTQN